MWTAFSSKIIVKNSSNGLTLQEQQQKDRKREREREENLRNEMAIEALSSSDFVNIPKNLIVHDYKKV